ncbi:hypothetical protein VP758_004974 [Vibrio harveyi]|nr:hypothetical protein [Vibrio harveyi]
MVALSEDIGEKTLMSNGSSSARNASVLRFNIELMYLKQVSGDDVVARLLATLFKNDKVMH